MGIKRNLVLLVSLLLVLLIPLSFTNFSSQSLGDEITEINQLQVSSGSNVLVDKVNIFTNAEPTVTFNSNIYLDKLYYYHISVKIVTPGECDLGISIIDPVGDRYDITNETDMEQDDLREIPYGTVLSGNYTFEFTAIFSNLSDILNIHIRIVKGEMVLADKISPQETVLYNNVTKFKTADIFELRVDLRSDWYYKVLIERVSTISLTLEDSRVYMSHFFQDPAANRNKIFENKSVSYSEYNFGTALPGIYTIVLIVFLGADVNCSNIAFALIEKGRIGTIIDPNEPTPPPPEEDLEDSVINNSTENRVQISTPQEFYFGVAIVCVTAVIVPIVVVVVVRRRKNMGGII